MNPPFDHDRVSESLSAFLDGSLPRAEAELVQEHLATCERCRAEAAVATSLRDGPDEPLTSSERLALEHRVMAGIADDAPAPVATLAPRSRVGSRVAQVLGAAAAVAVIGTLFYFGSTMSGGSDEEAGGDTAAIEEEAPEDRRARDKERNQPIAAAAQDAAEEGTSSKASGEGGGGGAGGTEALGAQPNPRFVVAEDPFTPERLQKLGESSLDSVRFASFYSTADADARNTLLEQLVESARDVAGEDAARQVDECGAQVLDTQDPTIPTFGYQGELGGKDVLVLGFAWSRSRTGALDRYMVWAWERGSCATAVDFVDGRIETAG